MMGVMTIAQLVAQILDCGVMTIEQERLLYEIIGEHRYTLEDMRQLNRLVNALRDGTIEAPDISLDG